MNLEDVRKELDQVDLEFKELFLKRMEIAKRIAKVKAESGDDIYKPDRETEVIEKLTDGVAPEFKSEYVAFLRRLMQLSREIQYAERLKINDDFFLEDSGIASPSHNRLKVRFACPDRCGALMNTISIIADYGINITDIRMAWEATDLIIYLELAANMLDENIKALLVQLYAETEGLKMIGSYQK
ncbi:MAG: chorismate mutase [Lachnospiraceae bacterium]|nr:chorismate mutase [Lachnospiraceae bacterium]